MKQIFKFFKLIAPYKKFLTENLIAGLLLTILGLPLPWFTKILIDNVYPNESLSLLKFVVIITLCFSVFNSLMGMMRGYFNFNLGIEMSVNVRLKFYRHLQSLSYEFFDKRETGELLSRQRDADQALGGVVGLIGSLFMNLTSLLIFPVILFYINWQLALISLVVLPFDMVIYYYVNKQVKILSQKLAEKNADISAKNYESLSGIKTIQALTLEDKIFNRIKKLIEDSIKLRLRLTIFQQGSEFLLGFLRAFGTLFYTYYGWTNILSGRMTLGSFMAFSSYVGYLYNPIKQLVEMTQQVQVTLVHINRFFEIYDLEPKIKNKPTALRINDIKGEIEFKNVSFSYENQSKILDNINLKIQPGITLISGKSGVGKSTMAGLIGRFYEPAKGNIYLDGYNIKDIDILSLRKNISFFVQEPFLFYGTLRENITCFNGKVIEEERFIKAVNSAFVDEFARELPKEYETVIGERGAMFSVGQKQRMALARIFLTDAPILILDEALNALDINLEKKIFKALEELARDKTIIVIAHRLSSEIKADKIILLEEGRIIEKDNQYELLENSTSNRNLSLKESVSYG